MIEYNQVTKLKRVDKLNFFRNLFYMEFVTGEAFLGVFVFLFKFIGTLLLFLICPFIDLYELAKRIPLCIRQEVLIHHIRRNPKYIEWRKNNG